MKALVKAKAERGIWMQDIDEPEVGHNDVLIKINRTAICGTDIHIFKWDDWAQATDSGATGGRPRVLRRSTPDGHRSAWL